MNAAMMNSSRRCGGEVEGMNARGTAGVGGTRTEEECEMENEGENGRGGEGRCSIEEAEMASVCGREKRVLLMKRRRELEGQSENET